MSLCNIKGGLHCMQLYCIWQSIPYAYIPDACGAVIKPFVVFISGSDKKGKCILCTTSAAACITGYPCSSTATNNMHRCMHTHNICSFMVPFLYITSCMVMYSTVKQQVTLNPCCTYVHINAIDAHILTSNQFCVTSDALLWEHIGTAGAAVTKGAWRTGLRDGFCIA